MFLRSLPAALLVLLQTQAAVHGARIIPPSARSIPGHNFGPRSLTNIPKACQANCAPFVPFLGGASCPVTECCSEIFEVGYFECFECVGNATKATDFTLAQEYVDVVTTSCISEGVPLPVLTLPGQNPNRTLASALPAGASSLPVFASAPSNSGSASASGSGSGISAPASSASGASVSGASVSGASVSGSSVSLSGSAPQSSATAPPQQSTFSPTSSSPVSSPSPSGSAPPNAGVRLRASGMGVGIAALLALLM